MSIYWYCEEVTFIHDIYNISLYLILEKEQVLLIYCVLFGNNFFPA